jgi:hypothetical protein
VASIRRRIVGRLQRHVGAKNDTDLQGATVTASFLKSLSKGTGFSQQDIDGVVAEFGLRVSATSSHAALEPKSAHPAKRSYSRKLLLLAVVAVALVAALVYAANKSSAGQESTDTSSASASSTSSDRRLSAEDAKRRCLSEVMSEQERVVAMCETQDCIDREVRSLMNACASRYGY